LDFEARDKTRKDVLCLSERTVIWQPVSLPCTLLHLFATSPLARPADRDRLPSTRDVAITRISLYVPHCRVHIKTIPQNDATWSWTVNLTHFNQNHYPLRPQGVLTTPFSPPWNRSRLGSPDRSRTFAGCRPEIQSTIFYILPYAYYIRLSLSYPPTRVECCTSYTDINIS
jgi:hypothetical protein